MNTWVNRRIENSAYDINELLNPGESYKCIADSGEAQTYQVNSENGKRIIKVYKCTLTEDLKNTFETINRMRHPAIAEILSFGEMSSGQAYETRKFYDKISLRDKPENLINAVMKIADAINELHIEGFSCLDIKPENIVLTDDSAVIVDVGSFVGFKSEGLAYTNRYSAPELDRGADNCSSDYYSLGISIFELITEKNPFLKTAEDTMSKKDLYDIKYNPKWWFPIYETGNSLVELISNLITPDTAKRWGYSDILQWRNRADVNKVSKEIKDITSRYHQPILYKGKTIQDIKTLVYELIKNWDINYIFQQTVNLSYIDIYLATKVGLLLNLIKSKDLNNLGDDQKAFVLVQLYCEYFSENDEVFLYSEKKVNSFDSVFELGNYLFNLGEKLYYDDAYRKNIDDYNALIGAASEHIFSSYMKKCREPNAIARTEVILTCEKRISKKRDAYDNFYDLIVISYALMGKRIIQLELPDSKIKVDIKTVSGLGNLLMKNMNSREQALMLLKLLTYKDIKISPIYKAWSDSLKMNY